MKRHLDPVLDKAFARLAGELARKGQQPLANNPYKAGTEPHMEWNEGYLRPRKLETV